MIVAKSDWPLSEPEAPVLSSTRRTDGSWHVPSPPNGVRPPWLLVWLDSPSHVDARETRRVGGAQGSDECENEASRPAIGAESARPSYSVSEASWRWKQSTGVRWQPSGPPAFAEAINRSTVQFEAVENEQRKKKCSIFRKDCSEDAKRVRHPPLSRGESRCFATTPPQPRISPVWQFPIATPSRIRNPLISRLTPLTRVSSVFCVRGGRNPCRRESLANRSASPCSPHARERAGWLAPNV